MAEIVPIKPPPSATIYCATCNVATPIEEEGCRGCGKAFADSPFDKANRAILKSFLESK